MRGKNSFEINFFEGIHKRCPQYTEVVEILGGLYTRQGRVDEGLKMDRKLVRLVPHNPTAHYNLACSLALKRRRRDAIESLNRAIELGYDDVDWLLNDPDLDSIRNSAGFKKLVAGLKQIT